MPVLVLDGAAGTYLESLGAVLHPTLWSSGALSTPDGRDSLRKMHRAYIDAGADVITSTTYQASVPGFMDEGLSESESVQLITDGVTSAKEEAAKLQTPDRKVLVAGGLGPYGAYLSHGEEYTGNYGDVTYEQLKEFWLPRVHAVLAGRPDVLLFETVPNSLELELIFKDLAPIAEAANIPVWVSLSIKESDSNEKSIVLADGTPLSTLTKSVPNPSAGWRIGANCFDINSTEKVINALRLFKMPILVYPNSGEIYDGTEKTWTQRHKNVQENVLDPAAWAARGADVIGGCCRTSPETIIGIKRSLQRQK